VNTGHQARFFWHHMVANVVNDDIVNVLKKNKKILRFWLDDRNSVHPVESLAPTNLRVLLGDLA